MKRSMVSAAVLVGLATLGEARAGTIVVSGPGLASGTLTASSAAGATTSPFPLAALGNAGAAGATFLSSATIPTLTGGSISFTPNSQSPHAGLWDGSTAGTAVSPYSGTNLIPGNYLVAQPNDPVTMFVPNPADPISHNSNTLDLLWGSVSRADQLSLDFVNDGIELFRLTVTGAMVAQAINQGTGCTTHCFAADGTTSAFVSLNELPGFNEVIVTSDGTSPFEFVPNLPVGSTTAAPEPASLLVLGAGLAGLAAARRFRNR